MKKIIFKYMFTGVISGFVIGACGSPDGAGTEGAETVVRSASAELGSASHGNVRQNGTRAVNQSDPTLTPVSERTSHRLTITIGGKSGTYAYSSGSWIPSGIAAKFPGNAAADVQLILAPVVEDPVGRQKGSAEQLLDADILTGALMNQPPVNDLPAVVLTHANTLLDFEIPGLTADDLNAAMINIDNTVTPYIVDGDTKLLAIVESGAKTTTLFIGIGSGWFSAFITPSVGEFQPNTRYRFRVILEVQGIRIENVAVSQWDEKESGSGTVTEIP